MIPYLMPKRTEAFVFYEELIDVTEALAFVEKWNHEHPPELKITIFHVLLAGFARGLIARPGLDRFISGGRLYQHSESHISFVVKRELKDEGAVMTVKFKIIPGEPFAAMVQRMHDRIADGRDHGDQAVDRELKLVLAMPGFLVSFALWVSRKLDSWNLLPYFMIKNDPFYTSIFAANLGSLGIDRVFHHLYEYGTASLFAAIGAVKKTVFVGPDDQPVVRPGLVVRWTFDERVNDGHYCVASLAIARRHIEHPERLLEPWMEAQAEK